MFEQSIHRQPRNRSLRINARHEHFCCALESVPGRRGMRSAPAMDSEQDYLCCQVWVDHNDLRFVSISVATAEYISKAKRDVMRIHAHDAAKASASWPANNRPRPSGSSSLRRLTDVLSTVGCRRCISTITAVLIVFWSLIDAHALIRTSCSSTLGRRLELRTAGSRKELNHRRVHGLL